MKVNLLIFGLVMFGCAHGVKDESIETDVETKIPTPTHTHEPKEEPEEKPNLSGKECKVIQTVYADNCVLEVIKCTDDAMDFNSHCYGPRWNPPFEWYPDPVINKELNNE